MKINFSFDLLSASVSLLFRIYAFSSGFISEHHS